MPDMILVLRGEAGTLDFEERSEISAPHGTGRRTHGMAATIELTAPAEIDRLRRFLARARRRALLLLAAESLLYASLIGLVLAAALLAGRQATGLRPLVIGLSLAAAVGLSGAILLLRRAGRRNGYLRVVDDRYDAAGRLIVAAEFLAAREPLDAFRRLALVDAAEWIDRRRDIGLPWTWPRRWPRALMMLALACALAGCQEPSKPASVREQSKPHDKIAVAPPDGGSPNRPVQPPPPPGSEPPTTPEHPFGKPAPRPDGVTYGSQPVPADRGPAAGAGRNPQPGLAGNPPPVAPPGGSRAGTTDGPKQPDPRGVQAARKDIESQGKKGGGTPSGPEKPGTDRKPGAAFAKGGAPGSTTQPADEIRFDGIEIDEMTLERLPPEQRERVRRYNENLRRLREQQASGVGSTTQPAPR
jgi:hypothetical protein